MADPQTNTAEGKGHGLLCPACKIDLTMSERQGIEIDYCPKCRGVWLDRGELDKIIERSVREDGPAPEGVRGAAEQRQPYPDQGRYDSGYSSGHGGHGGHGYRRKHSFLERLFD